MELITVLIISLIGSFGMSYFLNKLLWDPYMKYMNDTAEHPATIYYVFAISTYFIVFAIFMGIGLMIV